MSDTTKIGMPAWLPFVIGTLLVIQFAGLGAWQFNKGLDKRAERELYGDDAAGRPYVSGMDVVPYQKIHVTGTFDAERQILLDNIAIESGLGFYVITPFRPANGDPVILVNRGWIPRNARATSPDLLAIRDLSEITVAGRASSLPQSGFKMGEAFAGEQSWPMTAVFPTVADVAAQLNEPVDAMVLLLDPMAANGYYRLWEPEEMGPGRHFAYALQWFAMAIVLAALLVFHRRRQRAQRG